MIAILRLWVSWLFPLLAFVVGARYGETGIRVAGASLEVLGALLVFVRYALNSKTLGIPVSKTWDAIVLWWMRLSGQTRIGQMSAHGTITISGHAFGHVRPSKEADVNAQIEALWNALDNAHQRLSHSDKERREGLQRLSEELSRERTERDAQVRDLNAKLSKIATGGVVDAVGIAWIVSGITLATFSRDIVAMIG